MKKLFKDIRHNDIDAVRNAIKKKPAVVNEVFDGQKPKRMLVSHRFKWQLNVDISRS